MKIAALTYYYLPIINGVTLTIADWKRLAEKNGVDFFVFTSQLGMQLTREKNVIEFPAIPVYRKMGVSMPFFPENFLTTEMRKREIELIHVHHPYIMGDLALRVGEKLHLPVIFTYHSRYSLYVNTYLPFAPKPWVNFLVNRSLVHFMNKTQAVTVALPALKRELVRRGVRVPIYVVPIGIDTARFAGGDREKVRSELGVDKNQILLVGTGRLAREKNWLFILKVFRLLASRNPKLRLVLVGNGPDLGRLSSLIKKWRFVGQTMIVPTATPQSMPDYYAAGDIYVNASLSETFGRVFVEAMAAGLPTVAFATGPSQDLFGDVSGILVRKRRVKAFAQAINSLITSPTLRRQIGKNAQLRAREFFDLTVSFQKLREVYEKVLEGNH